jgi:DNA polymerase III epsilon subunit-like protein
MIILDIETSGLDTGKCGIWQIASIELENPDNYFLEEGRIDDEDIITEGALKITGKTEKYFRDSKKQSQKQLILNYLKWRETCKGKINIGQNVGWDFTFIQDKCIRYDLLDKLHKIMGQRAIELHTIVQKKYFEINGNYSEDENGKSNMNLTKILEFCGLPDKRMNLEVDKMTKKGTAHNALEDCRLTGECYYRLEYGKNIFEEFKKFKVPVYLKK